MPQSFAVSTQKIDRIISTEFKAAGHPVYLFAPKTDANGLPDFESLRAMLDTVRDRIADGTAVSGWAVGAGGICEGITKMALGNGIGFAFEEGTDVDRVFAPLHGAILLECVSECDGGELLGRTTENFEIRLDGETINGLAMQGRWEETLHSVYPYHMPAPKEEAPEVRWDGGMVIAASEKFAKPSSIKLAQPRVLIPVFPGTNCEYDVARVFAMEGAAPEIFVVRNRTSAEIEESANAFAELIRQSQIVSIPGGFSEKVWGLDNRQLYRIPEDEVE